MKFLETDRADNMGCSLTEEVATEILHTSTHNVAFVTSILESIPFIRPGAVADSEVTPFRCWRSRDGFCHGRGKKMLFIRIKARPCPTMAILISAAGWAHLIWLMVTVIGSGILGAKALTEDGSRKDWVDEAVISGSRNDCLKEGK